MADAARAGELPLLLVISASASPTSRSDKLADHVAQRCAKGAFRSGHMKLRTLPAGALLPAGTSNVEIAAAVPLLDEVVDAFRVAIASASIQQRTLQL